MKRSLQGIGPEEGVVRGGGGGKKAGGGAVRFVGWGGQVFMISRRPCGEKRHKREGMAKKKNETQPAERL